MQAHTGGAGHDLVIAGLCDAGARFAFVFGSRAEGRGRPDSDLDVGTWWGAHPPPPWKVPVPDGVDLLVLDSAPWNWLGGSLCEGHP